MRLLLIRHGQSRHSVQKIIATHQACLGLTEHGLQQAQALALHLKPLLPAHYVLLSSPALRARETAEQLSQILEWPLEDPDSDLLEIATGHAEGLTWEAYESVYGSFDLVSEPNRPFAPEGECWIDFLKRVESLLNRWREQYQDQTVVAVTHAGFIVAAFLILFVIRPGQTVARIEPEYTSLTEWEFTDHWTLIRFNDTSHLIQ